MFRCGDLVRFGNVLVRVRKVLAEKMLGEVPEGSGRFGKVPVQRPCEGPEGFSGEGGFERGYFAKFWRVLVQMLFEIPKASDVFYLHKHLIFMA